MNVTTTTTTTTAATYRTGPLAPLLAALRDAENAAPAVMAPDGTIPLTLTNFDLLNLLTDLTEALDARDRGIVAAYDHDGWRWADGLAGYAAHVHGVDL